MSEQHTPGPWVVHPLFPHIIVHERDAHKKIGGSIHEDEDRAMYAIQILTANHDRYSGFAHEISPDEAKANARIAASAPDLLNAARAVATWVMQRPAVHPYDAWQALNAAIARAEGRT